MGPCLTGANERYIGDALLQKTYTTDCISKTVKKNQGERPMVYVENNHPPIIPKEIFYQVREEMARRSSKRKVMQRTAKGYRLFQLRMPCNTDQGQTSQIRMQNGVNSGIRIPAGITYISLRLCNL